MVESLAADKAADAKALSELGDRLSGYLNEVESTQYLDAKAEVAAAAALIADWGAYATALTAAPATGEPLAGPGGTRRTAPDSHRPGPVQGGDPHPARDRRVREGRGDHQSGAVHQEWRGRVRGRHADRLHAHRSVGSRHRERLDPGQIDLVKYNLKEGELIRDRTVTLGLPEKKGGGWFWS